MKGVVLGIMVAICFVMVLGGIGAHIFGYAKTNDVDGWLEQATVAGNAPHMDYLLNEAVVEMERLGMTEGRVQLIPKKASLDMAVKFQTVRQMQQRANYVAQNTDLYSLQESQALADLRVAISDLEVSASNWYVINHWMPFFGNLAICGWWLVICIIATIACVTDAWD